MILTTDRVCRTLDTLSRLRKFIRRVRCFAPRPGSKKKRTGDHQTVVFWFVISASWLGTFPPRAASCFRALRRAPPRSAAPPRAPRRTLLRARVVVLDAHAVLARGTGMLARVLSR